MTAQMKSIDIDLEVFNKIEELAIPFIDTTPNHVIRRILGLQDKELSAGVSQKLDKSSIDAFTNQKIKGSYQNEVISSSSTIEYLKSHSIKTDSAFLTFLMDKFNNTEGNFTTSKILSFMKQMHLITGDGQFQNPWMNAPYKNKESCTQTIEHFRQPRKFGCRQGRDSKLGCDAKDYCKYHPENPEKMKVKCDLRKNVIWKKDNPTKSAPYAYGRNHLQIIETELLKGDKIYLEELLAVFYPTDKFGTTLIDKFISDFHFTDNEMHVLFITEPRK